LVCNARYVLVFKKRILLIDEIEDMRQSDEASTLRSQALWSSIGGKVSVTHVGIVDVKEATTNPQVNSAT
jgi:hypothetical protein